MMNESIRIVPIVLTWTATTLTQSRSLAARAPGHTITARQCNDHQTELDRRSQLEMERLSKTVDINANNNETMLDNITKWYTYTHSHTSTWEDKSHEIFVRGGGGGGGGRQEATLRAAVGRVCGLYKHNIYAFSVGAYALVACILQLASFYHAPG